MLNVSSCPVGHNPMGSIRTLAPASFTRLLGGGPCWEHPPSAVERLLLAPYRPCRSPTTSNTTPDTTRAPRATYDQVLSEPTRVESTFVRGTPMRQQGCRVLGVPVTESWLMITPHQSCG